MTDGRERQGLDGKGTQRLEWTRDRRDDREPQKEDGNEMAHRMTGLHGREEGILLMD